MFGQKNNPTPQVGNTTSPQVNLNQKNDFNIDELPIRTMADDLMHIKDPHTAKNPLPDTNKLTTAKQENLTPKQKSSPFLKTDNTWNERSVLSERTENIEAPRQSLSPRVKPESQAKETFSATIPSTVPKIVVDHNVQNSAPKERTPKTNLNLKIILLLIISLVLAAALAFAGYSFWKKKANQAQISPVVEMPTPEITQPPIAEQPPITPTLSYSQDNPNYLPLVEADPEKVVAILKQYIQKTGQEGYTKPVEFIVTDEKNAPLKFKDFAMRLGLKFSLPLTNNLGDNFSLFIYNDGVVSRVGLMIDSKNDPELAKTLLQEEKSLADEINPIFFTTDYRKDKSFFSSEYGDVKIRYQNIISPENLSIDYTVYKNKFIIGTTKMTLRAIVDHLINVSATATTPISSTPQSSNISPTAQPAPTTPMQAPVDNLNNKIK